MKVRLLTTGAVLATTVLLGGTAGAQAAAVPTGTSGAPAASSESRSLAAAQNTPAAAAAGWEYHSWYWTYASCHSNGQRLVRNNPSVWSDYRCRDHGSGVTVLLDLYRR
ncbi:hypothetical protein ACWD4V_26950 [Streptomyces tsukubensis]|uniref:hypothetical protein n=1 Tax=Streptomyces tsukubensis TaxID=83656 RepID=UPI00369805C7